MTNHTPINIETVGASWVAYADKIALHLSEHPMDGWPFERRVGYMLGYAAAQNSRGCGLPILLLIAKAQAARPSHELCSPLTSADYRMLAELIETALGEPPDDTVARTDGACCPGCLARGQIQADHFTCSELREGELREGAWIATEGVSS